MRPYQWIKNAFVFIGLLFGHTWHDQNLVIKVAVTFFAFCCVSSAVYVVNDMVDIDQDRLHPKKCRRPLAARAIAARYAAIFAALLAMMAAGLSCYASPTVLGFVMGYAVMNVCYSLWLKHIVILDVFVIAAGFMLRILAGTKGLGIPPSQWLLLCGLMLTLFLGFAKRRAEVIALPSDKKLHRNVLEHYSPVMLDTMIGITASGLIMSYSLYSMSPDTLRIHGTANLIYTVPFVIYGVFRYIYLLYHQTGGGDPSSDLVHDPHLLVVTGVWLFSIVLLIS